MSQPMPTQLDVGDISHILCYIGVHWTWARHYAILRPLSRGMGVMSLGKRLRMYIDVHGMTVRDFSRHFGIPYRSVHEYLSNKRRPSAEHLENMARCGIDITWLVLGQARASITYDFTGYCDRIKPISGIFAADEKLSQYFLNDAIKVVDHIMMENPNLVKEMGLVGCLASAVSIWGTYAEAINNISDYVVEARKSGRSADDLGSEVVKLLGPFIRERLQLMGPQSPASSAVDAASE